MIVMAMVRVAEMIARASWVKSDENVLSPTCPRYAPSIVIEIFPRNIARQNLTGLYFMSPSGIMTGSSGTGVAATRSRARKAHFFTFRPVVFRRSLRFSLRKPPRKKVTR